MASRSFSSASVAAASGMSQGSSQASSAAAQASSSLASGSAKASNYAGKLAKDVPTQSTSSGYGSTFTLTLLAIAIGAAYYKGYLNGLITYMQQLLNQAQDQKEHILKDNADTTSARAAAKGGLNQTAVKASELTDRLRAKAQEQETSQTRNFQPGGPATLLSAEAH